MAGTVGDASSVVLSGSGTVRPAKNPSALKKDERKLVADDGTEITLDQYQGKQCAMCDV